MSAAYYDTNYLLKLQIVEAGTADVRRHAATVTTIYCAHHGRAEFASAAFRKVREGMATSADYRHLIGQFNADIATSAIVLVPLTGAILDRVESVFTAAPTTIYLRAADAIHLATAAEHGFREIHSNDKHLLAAAPLFGLRGVNVIP
jgi:predicted nucleic acid-binding protein